MKFKKPFVPEDTDFAEMATLRRIAENERVEFLKKKFAHLLRPVIQRSTIENRA